MTELVTKQASSFTFSMLFFYIDPLLGFFDNGQNTIGSNGRLCHDFIPCVQYYKATPHDQPLPLKPLIHSSNELISVHSPN